MTSPSGPRWSRYHCSQWHVAFPWTGAGNRYKITTETAVTAWYGRSGLLFRWQLEAVTDTWKRGQERLGIWIRLEFGTDAADPGPQI